MIGARASATSFACPTNAVLRRRRWELRCRDGEICLASVSWVFALDRLSGFDVFLRTKRTALYNSQSLIFDMEENWHKPHSLSRYDFASAVW